MASAPAGIFGLCHAVTGALRPLADSAPVLQAARGYLRPLLAQLPGLLQKMTQALGRLPGQLLPSVKAVLRAATPNKARAPKDALRALGRSEAGAILLRLCAYAGALGVMALPAAYFVHSAPSLMAAEPAPVTAWRQVAKPYAAFSVLMTELAERDHDYAMRRHISGGGRQDILTWGELKGSTPHLMVEIYRPGAELTGFGSAEQEIAARLKRSGGSAVQYVGEMESKFGTASLVEFSLGEPLRQCLGFVRAYEDPKLQILGWHCTSGSTPVHRDVVACALDRLTLVAAGSEPKLRELFARAELKRNFCGQRSHLLAPTPKLGPSAPPPEPKSAANMAKRVFAKSPAAGLLR
jgi:hypothetical protein